MVETLTALITGHLAGDFLLQWDWLVQRKKKLPFMLLHIAIVVLITALVLGSLNPQLLGIILFTHLAIDLIKTHKLPDTLWSLILDQLAHIAVLAGVAWIYPNALSQGWWFQWLNERHDKVIFLSVITIVGGIALCVIAGGILIGKAMTPLTDQIDKNKLDGLKNGGRYIGWLERILIFLFILMGSLEGVGFLLGAKSILRFGEIKEQEDRKVTEYIIIGTFFSFGWGIFVTQLTLLALKFWKS